MQRNKLKFLTFHRRFVISVSSLPKYLLSIGSNCINICYEDCDNIYMKYMVVDYLNP